MNIIREQYNYIMYDCKKMKKKTLELAFFR